MKKSELAKFRKDMKIIIEHVSSQDCVPQQIMTATRENASSRWSAKKDRENYAKSVGSYLEDFQAGLLTIVKPARVKSAR
jgi:predicted ATP-binding protein involved in virulence